MWKNLLSGRATDNYDAGALHAGYPKATNTHPQFVQYSLLFQCNNSCTNAPACYVIRTVAVWYYCI